MAELAALIVGGFGAPGAAVAGIGTSQAAQLAAIAATAAAASKAGAKGPGMVPKLLQPRIAEAALSRFKQDQRELLRKRRASVATQTRLEEPILGKQSLLGV